MAICTCPVVEPEDMKDGIHTLCLGTLTDDELQIRKTQARRKKK